MVIVNRELLDGPGLFYIGYQEVIYDVSDPCQNLFLAYCLVIYVFIQCIYHFKSFFEEILDMMRNKGHIQ